MAAETIETTTSGTSDVSRQLDDIRQLLARRDSDTAAAGETRTDRILTVAGSVMVPFGIVAILLGWYGTSRTPYLFDQVPYLISGGLLGVGLVIGGGLLFFGSWIARLEQLQSAGTDELVAAIDALRVELEHRLADGGVLGAATSTNGAAPLVATPTGTMVLRPDCAVVSRRDPGALVTVAAGADGYGACKLCDPLTD